MKKYSLLLSLSIVTTTTNSCAIIQKIFITKTAITRMQQIGQDYQTITNFINKNSQKLNSYKKPSDLINDLLQEKSINTKYMTPEMVFFKNDINFLDQQFEKASTQHGMDFAWNNIIFLMHTKLENTCDDLKDNEVIKSAARVALKQEQSHASNNLMFFSNEYEDKNIVSFDTKHWSKEDKENMSERINTLKNNLSRE